MKKTVLFPLSFFLTGIVALFSACSNDGDYVIPEKPDVSQDINLIVDKKFGKILTDERGYTLYFFTPDVNSPTICTGECEVAWPVYYKENPSLSDGLDKKDFSVVIRPDGKKQTTYKGWPLYFFFEDKKPGEIKGDGLENAWFVAKPDYTIMIGHGQLIGEDGKEYTSKYQLGKERFTPYFTNDYGITLYNFSKDTQDKNNFTSETDEVKNAVFPIFSHNNDIILPSVLNKADFRIVKVFNKNQLSYKGRPIYTYSKDNNQIGSTKAVSVSTPGVWPVATDDNIPLILPGPATK